MFRKLSILVVLLAARSGWTMTTTGLTLFNPTEPGVNVAVYDGIFLTSPPATWQLGLFDDDIITGGGPDFSGAGYLPLDPAGDVAQFTGNQVANNNGDSFTLTGDQTFFLALDRGSGWAAPDSVSCNAGAQGCGLAWTGGALAFVADVAPVPLPPALPLFLGTLLGLGLMRRRHS